MGLGAEIFNYLVALCFAYYVNSLAFYLVEPSLGFILLFMEITVFFFVWGRNEFFCWSKNGPSILHELPASGQYGHEGIEEFIRYKTCLVRKPAGCNLKPASSNI